MQHPVVRTAANVTPDNADAFLALVFLPTVDDASRSEPEIWPVRKDKPIEIGESIRFVLTDDNVAFHPDGLEEPSATEIPISKNADVATAIDLAGLCIAAVFTDIEEARAWAKTIDDIFDADLPYPLSYVPSAEDDEVEAAISV